MKSYTYLDQAPTQSIDIHEGLDDTLVMLGSKLKIGIQVRRDYAPDLPHIEAFGSELNQVWTNIVDNAIDAIDGHSEIVIKTSQSNTDVMSRLRIRVQVYHHRFKKKYLILFSRRNHREKGQV